jgi:hypothetical protein
MKNQIFSQKTVFFGWLTVIIMLIFIPKVKPSEFIDSELPIRLASIEYCMDSNQLKHEIVEYLNEQEIRYTEKEPIRLLMAKAIKIGYSPSDEMYKVENGIYIPSDNEVNQTKDTVIMLGYKLPVSQRTILKDTK